MDGPDAAALAEGRAHDMDAPQPRRGDHVRSSPVMGRVCTVVSRVQHTIGRVAGSRAQRASLRIANTLLYSGVPAFHWVVLSGKVVRLAHAVPPPSVRPDELGSKESEHRSIQISTCVFRPPRRAVSSAPVSLLLNHPVESSHARCAVGSRACSRTPPPACVQTQVLRPSPKAV